MDFHMEHLNHVFKSAISQLGPNIIDPSLAQTGRALRPISSLQDHFDVVTNMPTESNYHSKPNTKRDLLEVIRILQQEAVFTTTPKRRFKNFKSMSGSLMNNVDAKTLEDWMSSHFKNMIRYL